MLSIKTKLLISYTIVFGILIVGYSIYIYHRMQSTALGQLDDRIVLFADRFNSELDEKIRHHGILTENEIRDAQKETLEPFQVRLDNREGTVIYSDSIFSRIRVRAATPLNNKTIRFDIQTDDTNEYRTAWIRIKDARFDGILFIAASMADLDSNLRQLRWSFSVTIPFAFILALVAAYGITRIGFRPLTMMVESAGSITANNLDQQLPVPRANDEVRLMGLTFNSMIGRIATAFKSQKQFIADASHEFRTPLTVIGSELEYARRGVSKKKVNESIRIALGEVDHLKQLTDDLLLIAKLDSHQIQLNKKIFRFDELVVDCVRKITHIASEKGITFRFNIDPGIEILGDEEKLGSVVVNILDNAVKYGRKRSVVEVNLKSINNSNGTLAVTNTGSGIPFDQQGMIFDRFFRGSSSRTDHSGSGLGLAIAKQIVEMHLGTISVVSIPKKKTIFTVSLPAKSQ